MDDDKHEKERASKKITKELMAIYSLIESKSVLNAFVNVVSQSLKKR
ncbi:MAG: hypothetical protein ACTS73_05360 [Arsenophonus sp. NEOnobi-MAG3]